VAELTRGIDGLFAQFMAQNEQQLSGIRSTVENRLSAMQEDNAAKLEQMRKTVDERLEKTLETRLGQSFKMVRSIQPLCAYSVAEWRVPMGNVILETKNLTK
ncbi:hypothetical protein NE463_20205, partial [Anaerotruncus colihominis]|nr:hypothetical protein [Anaerotruncus colihominis]